jgi:multiple sugar transport system permease protein
VGRAAGFHVRGIPVFSTRDFQIPGCTSRTLPYLLILPSLLLAAVVIFWPVVRPGCRYATHEVSRFGQLRDFADGWQISLHFSQRSDFLNRGVVAHRTVDLSVVGGALIVSIPVAIILNIGFLRPFGLARVIILLPWAVSLTMTAVVWRWALNGESGMLNSALIAISVSSTSNIQWLASAGHGLPNAGADRHPGHRAVHGHHLPRRTVVDPG